MDEQPGLSDQYRMASPWPVFVALGLALSEVGVFMGVFPVAVGGILLFGGSIAGILRESGYVSRPWQTLAQVGVVFLVLGGALVVWQVDAVSTGLLAVVTQPGGDGFVSRGLSVAVGGVMLLAAGGTGSLMNRTAT